jgi:hypothetical protein
MKHHNYTRLFILIFTLLTVLTSCFKTDDSFQKNPLTSIALESFQKKINNYLETKANNSGDSVKSNIAKIRNNIIISSFWIEQLEDGTQLHIFPLKKTYKTRLNGDFYEKILVIREDNNLQYQNCFIVEFISTPLAQVKSTKLLSKLYSNNQQIETGKFVFYLLNDVPAIGMSFLNGQLIEHSFTTKSKKNLSVANSNANGCTTYYYFYNIYQGGTLVNSIFLFSQVECDWSGGGECSPTAIDCGNGGGGGGTGDNAPSDEELLLLEIPCASSFNFLHQVVNTWQSAVVTDYRFGLLNRRNNLEYYINIGNIEVGMPYQTYNGTLIHNAPQIAAEAAAIAEGEVMFALNAYLAINPSVLPNQINNETYKLLFKTAYQRELNRILSREYYDNNPNINVAKVNYDQAQFVIQNPTLYRSLKFFGRDCF